MSSFIIVKKSLYIYAYTHTHTHIYICLCIYKWVFQVALVVKNLSANEGDVKEAGSIPELGRSPGEGNGNPLQHSCLENPMDRGTGGLHSMGSHRVRHDWSNLACTHTYIYFHKYMCLYIYILNLACTSGSSWFTYCWSLAFRILNINLASMWNEHNCMVV